MSTSALLLLPIDVWMAITPHLQAQDVLNLSFTCRQWYKDLADQQLWEAVYKNVLPEYPTSHFLVPDSVEKVKRRDFISLNGSEPRRLDQWSKSWKQRTVYVQHIINIQTRIVSSLRLRTNAFEPVIPKPIHDIARVHKMEAYLKSALPIDMVIFMVYFAHHVRPRPNTSLSGMTYGYSLSILSSDEFLCEKKWEDMVHEVSWLRFDVKFPLQNEKRRLYHISRGTRQFLNQLRFAPFARVSKAGNYRGSNIALSVMLSKNQDPPSDLPNTVTNQVYRLDTKHMPNAVGKVFITLTRANHRYDTHLVSESFTDYLLQYAGVVLEYGDIPIAGDMRQIDLMVRLPRPQIPKPSILLPQPPYWDICHYLPTCFPKLDVPLNPLPDRSDISQVMSSITAYERLIDMEKLPSIPIPIPTKYINSSIYKYHWNTCYGLLVLRNPLTISKRLVDCSIRNGIDIDQVSYDMLEYIAQEWITATPSSILTKKAFGEAVIQDSIHKTFDLRALFQLHRQCLPISLYYDQLGFAWRYLETHKCIHDHLHGITRREPKYVREELNKLQNKVKCQLNYLGIMIERFPAPCTDFHSFDRDLSNIRTFNWEYIE